MEYEVSMLEKVPFTNQATRWCAALIAAISAGSVQAAQTSKVMVRFVGDAACIARIPDRINVVLDGDETNQFTATRQNVDLWLGDSGKPSSENFNAENRTVSVRTGGSRTDCRGSRLEKDPSPHVRDGWVASVTFQCYRQAVRQVSVESRPDVPVSYVRRMAKAHQDADSRDCVEHKSFLESPTTINDVWFYPHQLRRESVRIQIGFDEPDLRAPGLLLNHPSVMKHLKGGDGILDVQTIVAILDEQRAEGLSSVPPFFSSNAYLNDFERLSRLVADKNKKLTLIVRTR
jgi:hypothetical protein